jgi:hypothetical protein
VRFRAPPYSGLNYRAIPPVVQLLAARREEEALVAAIISAFRQILDSDLKDE